MKYIETSESTECAGVVNVTLNRPEIRNAFHPEMIGEIQDFFQNLNQREDVFLIQLSGKGKSFCAGADLNWMKEMADYNYEENLKDSKALFDMFKTIALCPHPIVAEVQGHVMGGGLGLLSVCDVVAAEKETVFCFSEARLGLVPAVISPFVKKKMSLSKAHELMLTARRFGADEACRFGLIHFSGSKDKVQEFLSETTKNILSNGPEAVRESKKLLVSTFNDQVREQTSSVIALRRVSDEGQEGLKSFFEKRKPNWK